MKPMAERETLESLVRPDRESSDCARFEPDLAAYLDGHPASAELLAHLSTCSSCGEVATLVLLPDEF